MVSSILSSDGSLLLHLVSCVEEHSMNTTNASFARGCHGCHTNAKTRDLVFTDYAKR